MRQLFKNLLTICLLICFLAPLNTANAIVKGKLEYQIPIDYSRLSREEMETKAGIYYSAAVNNQDNSKTNGSNISNISDEMTSALNLYTMLHKQNPDVILYCVRLGHLYDLIGKDRYAKGYFFEALGIDKTQPEPYFMLGEFYYKRELYKKALNMYKKAYENGYSEHYRTLYKIGDIYQKYGDTEASLKYLRAASQINSDDEIGSKIQKVEEEDRINHAYYSNTRIRTIER